MEIEMQVSEGSRYRLNRSNTLSLLLPILSLFPPEMFTIDPPLELAFSYDDSPRGMLPYDFAEESEELVKAGKGRSDQVYS